MIECQKSLATGNDKGIQAFATRRLQSLAAGSDEGGQALATKHLQSLVTCDIETVVQESFSRE